MRISVLLQIFVTFFLFNSCVKNTDFEQANEIAFTPEIEANLIYFDLSANTFFDANNGTPDITIRDVTELEFLDSEEITGNIQKIEFFFDFNNSIQRVFNVKFEFLDKDDVVTYTMETEVSASNSGVPVRTVYIEVVESQDVRAIEGSRKMAAIITIPESNASLTGTIKLQSKATYFIEY